MTVSINPRLAKTHLPEFFKRGSYPLCRAHLLGRRRLRNGEVGKDSEQR